MVTNAACSVETPLNHRLGAYKDCISKLHGLRMFHDNSRANLQGVPGHPAHRTKYHASELGLEWTLFVSISGEQGE
jgi:hypothetical protein